MAYNLSVGQVIIKDGVILGGAFSDINIAANIIGHDATSTVFTGGVIVETNGFIPPSGDTTAIVIPSGVTTRIRFEKNWIKYTDDSGITLDYEPEVPTTAGSVDVSFRRNRIEFINLPAKAIIRIYSSSGVLVDLLEHNSTQAGGSKTWNVRNRNNQAVASGVYFFHVEANDQRKVGRMTIIRFAE